MTSERDMTVGLALVIGATLSFTLADIATKYLATRYPVQIILGARYILNALLILVFVYPKTGSALWRASRRLLVFVRGLCLAMASVTLTLALRVMPVGETIAIVYLSPFAVMLLAAPLLGERVSPKVWIWAAAGFLGALLIVRPGGGLDGWGVFLALLNASLATAYSLLTRVLSSTESTISMLFHTAWIGSVIFVVWSLPTLSDTSVASLDLWVMLGLGLASSIGHYLFTAAYRSAPASALAPFSYTHLIWAGLLGFAFFGTIPTTLSALGMLTICVSGVGIAFAGRRLRSL